MTARHAFLLLCASALGGCYLDHERVATELADAALPDAALRDAALADTATTDAGSDVGISACWDLQRDFSLTSPTFGAWSYGWATADGSFTLGSAHTNYGLSGWTGPMPGGLPGELFPYVMQNATDAPLDTILHYDPRECTLHPGPGCEAAEVRWTAPAGGTYTIHLAVRPQNTGPSGFALRVDGVERTSGTVAAGRGYDGTHALRAGSVVSVAVLCGPDGSYASDSTGVQLTVCTAP